MIVKTKPELKKAVHNKEREITVLGELADKVHTGKKVVSLGKVTLGLLASAIATLPMTGGLSAAVLAPIAAMTGVEIIALAAIVFVGLALLIAVWKGYDEVEFSHHNLKLRLKK